MQGVVRGCYEVSGELQKVLRGHQKISGGFYGASAVFTWSFEILEGI